MGSTKKVAEKKVKLCPLKLAGDNAQSESTRECDCEMSRCAWWVDGVYTTENIYDNRGRCAIHFIAEKNSDGRLPV